LVERDPDGTKAAILAAAEDIFAKCGFDATSMKAIGDAGVSRSTPSYFLGDKAGLYDAVLNEVIERARIAMLEAALGMGPRDSQQFLGGWWWSDGGVSGELWSSPRSS
jgi:AcrR family transcriptional regulator